MSARVNAALSMRAAMAARPSVRRASRDRTGVDVVVDRPPLELRDGQDRVHPLADWRLWHLLYRNHSRTVVQMCQWFSRCVEQADLYVMIRAAWCFVGAI